MNKLILLLILLSCSGPTVKIPISDHFDGERFYFPKNPMKEKSMFDLLEWKFKGSAAKWPKWIDTDQVKIKENRVTDNTAHITFINHSTTLIQMNGINILTDPIYAKRTSPVSFAGPARVKKPGVKFEDLPKIDVVIISHNHYDHFDVDTLEKLVERDNSKIIFGLGNSRYLKKHSKKNAVELDWEQSHQIKDVKITLLPCRHWNKRTLFDFNKTLWGAFSIEGAKKIYFAGDTGYDYHFKEAGTKIGPFDLAFIPIGAYEPRWFMKWAHINPQEAVLAHKDLRAKKSIGIHFGTFQLTDEAIDQPIIDLKKSLRENPIEGEFLIPENGSQYIIE